MIRNFPTAVKPQTAELIDVEFGTPSGMSIRCGAYKPWMGDPDRLQPACLDCAGKTRCEWTYRGRIEGRGKEVA